MRGGRPRRLAVAALLPLALVATTACGTGGEPGPPTVTAAADPRAGDGRLRAEVLVEDLEVLGVETLREAVGIVAANRAMAEAMAMVRSARAVAARARAAASPSAPSPFREPSPPASSTGSTTSSSQPIQSARPVATISMPVAALTTRKSPRFSRRTANAASWLRFNTTRPSGAVTGTPR